MQVLQTTPASGETDAPVDESDGDDDPDILPLALLTIGAAGAVALIALIGYLVRRGVGYDPHRPNGNGGDGAHH
jgi:hypothetical protein